MKPRKIIMSAAGVLITAVSVGAFKFSAFGVDPFQFFMCGVDVCIPLEFGTLYVIVNALLLSFSFLFARNYIGIATFINLFLLGYIVDFSQALLETCFPYASLAVRVVFFLLGFVFLCLGSSLYMTADLGVSTYDAVALILSKKWKLASFSHIRILTDGCCILLGLALLYWKDGSFSASSGYLGFGTIVTAFCMRPLIEVFNRTVSENLL